MKLIHVSGIATAIVIALGVLMVIPPFIPSDGAPPKIFLLSFTLDDTVSASWCQDLSSMLVKHNVKAAVYLSGKTAETTPECITSFSNQVDIGSQTHNYVPLDSITDYAVQLTEVEKGKNIIDIVGTLDSKLFKAPNGSTDENIYSLLSRSGILADFSYESQYNKYYQDQFIKFDLQTFDGITNDADFFRNVGTSTPTVISFDNNDDIQNIEKLISELKSRDTLFVNPSEITGLDLTVRKGGLN